MIVMIVIDDDSDDCDWFDAAAANDCYSNDDDRS